MYKYKVFFTYEAKTIDESGDWDCMEIRCTETVTCLEELEDLLQELRDNNCFDIFWMVVQ